MPRRTQLFNKIPWNGGINSAVDPGVLPDNDLVQADNVIFATSGARIKREGLDFFDALSAIPSVITRSSAGTTRTLVFASAVSSATNEQLVIGEDITVTSSAGETDYEGNVTVATISTTTVTNDTITYTATGVLAEVATGTSTLTIALNYSVIGIKDYWRTSTGSQKVQLLVSVTSQGKIFRYDAAGRRTEVNKDAGATALSSPTRASFEVINETLVIATDGLLNTPKKYNPDNNVDWEDLGGTPPNFDVVSEYRGRLFTNEKENKDRLHYSETGNPEKWNGAGDSGALDILPGDGDPEGIISISPPFKEAIFIGKKGKVLELQGDAPENFKPVPISNGIGFVAPRAIIPIDLDDLAFVSDRGIHSLLATASHGDFEGSFLSQKIQKDFNDFAPSRLKFISGAYLAEINSIAFSVASSGSSVQDQVWLFNTIVKEWYRWPDLSCQSLTTRLVNERERRFIFGTNDGRIIQAQNNKFTDFGTDAIEYTVKTGAIYPDNNPQTMKMFKKITFYFKPLAEFTFNVTSQIDNQDPVTTAVSQAVTGDLLGTTFILGSSELGSVGVFAPSTVTVDGIGRGITITVEDSTTNQPIEIYGLGIEYEQADINQERL